MRIEKPREQVRLELTEMDKALVMPLLRLKDMLGRQHTVPFQTDAPGFVNKKLAVSADYMLAQMIKAGSHKLVEYKKDILGGTIVCAAEEGSHRDR